MRGPATDRSAAIRARRAAKPAPGPSRLRTGYNCAMQDADDNGDVLDVLVRQAPERAPIPLSAQYLRAVARVEALPENRDGADKTWVLKLAEELARLQRSMVRAR